MSTFIKICGLREPAHLRLCLERQVDAVGFVAHPPSPRHVSPEELRVLLAGVECGATAKVGVFVGFDFAAIARYIEAGVDVAQLHGDITPAQIAELRRRSAGALREIWLAARPRRPADIDAALAGGADKLLVDAFATDGRHGGTGETADWELARLAVERRHPPVILAGGLDSNNLAAAFAAVKPFGFDVSSGVETSPGVKCPRKIAEFIAAARSLEL